MIALPLATIYYGGVCIVAGLFRVRYTPGGVYDRMQRGWARTILAAAGIPVTISGTEHLAPEGPQIIIANHASFFDILALLAWLPVNAKFIAKKELFAIPVLGGAMRASGHVRLDRRNRGQAFSAYENASKEMREKKLTVVVYPEGTRTLTGELLPFKKGAFVFAIEAGAPIVPCYVSGAFGIQPKGSIRVRKSAMHIALAERVPVDGLTVHDRDALLNTVESAMRAMKAAAA